MASKKKVIIGSRGSELALWQADFIQKALKKIGTESEIKIIKTQGDKIQNLSFDKLEGKGFFTKELEEALLSGDIDLAVHSHKDLQTTYPKGLTIAAVSYREDPSELIIVNKKSVDEKMKFSFKKDAIVGTSSARRKSQLLAFREDIKLKDLRGNVPTRIERLKKGEYDAIILAAAGIERLNPDLSDFHVEAVSPREFIPAPAQGVLALQVRKKDTALITLLEKLNHKDVEETISIERKVLNLFDGGCQLPLGVYCEKDEDDKGDDIYKVWISKAKNADTAPVVLYVESKKLEGLAETIVKKIEGINPSRVFITRDLKKNDFFKRVLESNGFKVKGKSLIEIKPVKFSRVPKTDWIFFASKHAVRNFFNQWPTSEDVKYGTVGKETAAEIRKFGKRADFIGYSTDVKLTGKQFASVAKSARVLFPQARGSMRSIQQQFTNPAQVVDFAVYETIKNNEEPVPKSDVLVFTSPSNVEAFFEKNKITPEHKIVAMGQATGNALTQLGVKKYKMPVSFDDVGLAQAVFGI